MDELHALRDSTGADMVSLIEDAPQYCGIAYLMGNLSPGFAASAFSVIHRTCATGYYSFAHELATTRRPPRSGPTPAAPCALRGAGTRNLGAFRTVMASQLLGWLHPGGIIFPTPTCAVQRPAHARGLGPA